MGVAEFFTTLYGEEAPGYLVLWTLEGKKSAWFPYSDLGKAVKLAGEASQSKNVYFGVSLQDKEGALELASVRNNRVTKPSETRGYAETATAIPGVWVDIDIAGTNHKQADLPKDLAEAGELVKAFPLKPTLLVHTGGGLHAYWLFKEPWIFESPEERDAAQGLVTNFQATLRAEARKRSWVLDSTYDLARVLRIPGTFNRKSNPPKTVTILEHNVDQRYNPDDIEQFCIEQTAEEKRGPAVDVEAIFAGISEGGRDNELFKYACRLRAQGRAKDEALVLVLAAAAKCQPPFAEDEARAKVDSAWKYQEGTPESRDVEEHATLVRLADLPNNPEKVFDAEVLGALAVLKENDTGEYMKIKHSLKGKVNLNDFEKAVKVTQDNRKTLHLVKQDEPLPLLETVLPDIPVKNMVIPHKWNLNMNGIHRADAKAGAVKGCSVPVIITKRLKELDNSQERIEIAFYRDRKWNFITTDRPTVFSHTAILQLASRGMPVSSSTARDLVQFLGDLEDANLDNLPRTDSVRHMGWAGKNFLPGAEGNVVLDLEDGTNYTASKYKAQGDLPDWITMVEPIRNYPLARIMMAAAFATPLLRMVGQRIFMIHTWGPSRGGKTASLKAALSVWAEPEGVMTSFNATKVGLERTASLYTDLPLGVNERQVAGDKQQFLESIVYMLTEGKGKTRGAKGGGLQQYTVWRTIVLTTGEYSITTDSSASGIRSRVMELYGLPMPDAEEYASSLHNKTDKIHGTAGPAFINRLILEDADNPNMVQEDYNLILEELTPAASGKIKSHLGYVALLTVADYYASRWVFGLEAGQAMDEALNLAHTTLKQLEDANEVDDGRQAHEYLMSWYDVNADYFKSSAPNGRRYGTAGLDYLFIYPVVFDSCMKKAGFSARRVLRDWANCGMIQTETRGDEGKVRFKVRRFLEDQGMKSYVAVKRQWPELGEKE